MYVVDTAAAELVCDGHVCVTRTHQSRLADLAGPGNKALRLLHGALGDEAPTSIRENTTVLPHGAAPRWSRETILFSFDDGIIDAAKGEDLTRALIAQGMVPGCSFVGWSGTLNDAAAQSIAASWILGDLKPLVGSPHSSADQIALARPVWKKLKALPRAEQRARIDAMHAGAISCKGGDAFDVLSGGASR
jgi:hypothetical protein